MKSNRNLIIVFLISLLAAWMYSRGKMFDSDGSPKPQKELYEVITPTFSGPEQTPAATPAPPPIVAATPPKTEKILSREEVAKVREFERRRLTNMYTAQRAFHAEFDRYTTDLKAMGYSVDEGELNVKVGFLREFSPPDLVDEFNENPENMNTDSLVNPKGSEAPRHTYSDAAAEISLDALSGYCKRGCTANQNDFEILVAMPLGGGRVDVWLVNSNKEVELVQDGLEQR